MVRPSPLTICSAPFSRVVWRCAPMARLFWPNRVPVSCRMQPFAITRSLPRAELSRLVESVCPPFPQPDSPTATKPSRHLYISMTPHKLDVERIALGVARALGPDGEVRIVPLDELFTLLGGQD